MSPIRNIAFLFCTAVFCSVLTACAPSPVQSTLDAPPVDQARALAAYQQSETRQQLMVAIDLLQHHARQNPDNYQTLARLANAYTLFGAGYVRNASEKEWAYSRAMQVAEQAMMTSAHYAEVRRRNGGFAEAVKTLDSSYLEAMEFWKTALFYRFREAKGVVDKVVRYPRLKQAVAVMEHMESLDRNAIGGSNLMSQGIYYLALPEFAGGDRELSAQYLAEAAAVSNRSILPRWGRAKYYAVAMNDYDLYRRDLEWVAAQPIDELIGFRPWNVLLQREAAAMLSSAPATG